MKNVKSKVLAHYSLPVFSMRLKVCNTKDFLIFKTMLKQVKKEMLAHNKSIIEREVKVKGEGKMAII